VSSYYDQSIVNQMRLVVMNQPESPQDIVRRLMAVAELLSTVATPDDLQPSPEATASNILSFPLQKQGGEQQHPSPKEAK